MKRGNLIAYRGKSVFIVSSSGYGFFHGMGYDPGRVRVLLFFKQNRNWRVPTENRAILHQNHSTTLGLEHQSECMAGGTQPNSLNPLQFPACNWSMTPCVRLRLTSLQLMLLNSPQIAVTSFYPVEIGVYRQQFESLL